MITHILELFHLITSFTESEGEADYPQQASFMHSNPHHIIQFLIKLDNYHAQLHLHQKRLILMQLTMDAREIRDKKTRWFKLMLASNQLKLASEKKHQEQQEYHSLLSFQLLLGHYFHFLLFMALFYLPPMLWRFTHQLKNPAPYQIPHTVADQQRHTKTLRLSLQKCEQVISQAVRSDTQQRLPVRSYLDLASASYDDHQMTATMKDGTRFHHGIDAKGQTFLTIENPSDALLSLDEQSNRRADFLAILFYQKYLLNIPDHHHADFWCPTSSPLKLQLDMPLPPYHHMKQEHRLICRVLYQLVHFGLEPILNGQPLTKQRLIKEHWADRLFNSQQSATTSVQSFAACAHQIAH